MTNDRKRTARRLVYALLMVAVAVVIGGLTA